MNIFNFLKSYLVTAVITTLGMIFPVANTFSAPPNAHPPESASSCVGSACAKSVSTKTLAVVNDTNGEQNNNSTPGDDNSGTSSDDNSGTSSDDNSGASGDDNSGTPSGNNSN